MWFSSCLPRNGRRRILSYLPELTTRHTPSMLFISAVRYFCGHYQTSLKLEEPSGPFLFPRNAAHLVRQV